MLASERRELLLKALQNAFPGREFCVADIMKRTCEPEMSIALTANFAQGWGKLPEPVIAIKIGRYLQLRIVGKRCGDLALLESLGKRRDITYYRVGPAPKPVLEPVLVIKRVDADGHIHTEILRGKDGEPLRDHGRQAGLEATAKHERRDEPVVDKPAEPPPVQQTGPPPAWRQPTRAELVERHRQSQTPSYDNSGGFGTGRPITPNKGRFDL